MSHAHAHAKWLMTGARPVGLRSNRIAAGWGNDPHSVRLANTAFEVYYRSMKHLNRLAGDSKAYTTLWKAIRAARTEGDGWGVDDLEVGFEHYSDCQPRKDWSDDTTEWYNVKKSHGMFNRNVYGPECCVNFLDKI